MAGYWADLQAWAAGLTFDGIWAALGWGKIAVWFLALVPVLWVGGAASWIVRWIVDSDWQKRLRAWFYRWVLYRALFWPVKMVTGWRLPTPEAEADPLRLWLDQRARESHAPSRWRSREFWREAGMFSGSVAYAAVLLGAAAAFLIWNGSAIVSEPPE